jgi:pimeloyl-ACP methyl ester carboxylesterase
MPTKNRSIMRRFLTVLVVLYLLGTVLGGIGLGSIALHPPSHPITASEERNARAAAQRDSASFQDMELKASDDAVLRAWFMRPHDANGNVVILLHGVSDNRLGMYGYGKWLLANRYSVLLPDARAHSLSTGLASYGLREADDIHRWIDWIETTEHPRCVFGLGESMGAAQLLQSLPLERRFCAIVAESPFATFREVAYARFGREFHTGPWLGRTFFHPTVDAGFLYVRLRYGLNMEEASPARAVEASKIPILLIHGLRDRNIPNYHSDWIQSHNPADILVWKVPGAGHTGAHAAAPREFEQRVLDWYSNHSSPEKNYGFL